MIAAFAVVAAASAAPAVELRRFPAPQAHQGVAAGRRWVYAVDNSSIARHDKRTGERVAVWAGDLVRYPHINSCTVRGRELVCAASNYPAVPMRSEALWFDAETLRPLRARELPSSHGSLTWLSWRGGEWWAGFANYDGRGGEPGRDHRHTVVVRFSARFTEQAVYRFPDTVLARFAPRSSSGGAWGRDGLLYVTGHDRPELYVMRAPPGGGVLQHVATIATPTGGQAIDWDPAEPRVLWSIDRKRGELVASRVPVSR